ncbi:MAG TPA: PPOX class F420-dependent oxidoreductase [Micromonosporaceae bacterium]|nr:PPOX class F420-dependent oxidoreductase [Micromonosporaceae bacterium]
MTTTVDELAASKYALMTTFRKDGTAVATPVWIVPYGDALAVWSYVGAGKVKRVRRRAAVTLATCDLRGNNVGESYPGRARILDAVATEEVRRQIRKKYGISGRLTLWLSKVRRGDAGTVGIEITID